MLYYGSSWPSEVSSGALASRVVSRLPSRFASRLALPRLAPSPPPLRKSSSETYSGQASLLCDPDP